MGMQYLYELSNDKKGFHAILLIDCSASMDAEKNNYMIPALESAKSIIYALKNNDSASLIYFNDKVDLKLNLTQMTEQNKEIFINTIEKEIKNKKTEGNTNFDIALKYAQNMANQNGNFAVFMITDGKDDNFITNANDFNNQNISLSVLNLSDYSNEKLKQLCEYTGGEYICSQNADDIVNNMEQLYKNYISKNNLLLNQKRPSEYQNWYYISISCIFYVIMGVLLTVCYCIIINRKNINIIFNIVGGIASAVIVEINNLFMDIEYISAVVMIFLICPAMLFYHTEKQHTINEFFQNEKTEEDENYIIK